MSGCEGAAKEAAPRLPSEAQRKRESEASSVAEMPEVYPADEIRRDASAEVAVHAQSWPSATAGDRAQTLRSREEDARK